MEVGPVALVEAVEAAPGLANGRELLLVATLLLPIAAAGLLLNVLLVLLVPLPTAAVGLAAVMDNVDVVVALTRVVLAAPTPLLFVATVVVDRLVGFAVFVSAEAVVAEAAGRLTVPLVGRDGPADAELGPTAVRVAVLAEDV